MTPIAVPMIIRTSRSATETRQKCRKERFLAYHYNSGGLEKNSGKYEAKFGIIVHDALRIKMIAAQQNGYVAALNYPITKQIADLDQLIVTQFSDLPAAELIHMRAEQRELLDVLVHGWIDKHLKHILDEYDIVNVEAEMSVVFNPSDYLPPQLAQLLRPVEYPFRFDVVLRRKSDGLLFIMDFKTTKTASEDWNVGLDNSQQSYLYCEAARIHYGEPIGGIFYAGLVRGHREQDKARSSPYRGYTIQYGSFLYGWKAKDGTVSADYATGKTRTELWTTKNYRVHGDMNKFFPITVPWKPLNIAKVVGQAIVAENEFQNNLELYEESHVHSGERALMENVLFEQTLSACFKYGPKHPCQFVEICHGGLHEDEIRMMYTKREDHHKEEAV